MVPHLESERRGVLGDLEVGEVDHVGQRGVAQQQDHKGGLCGQQPRSRGWSARLQYRDGGQQEQQRYGGHQPQQVHAVQLLALVRQQDALFWQHGAKIRSREALTFMDILSNAAHSS